MFVLDTSVTMTWCYDDEASADSEALLDRLRSEGATVPALWAVEVANALLVGERRQRLSEAELLGFLRLIQTLPIAIDSLTPMDILGPVRGLARDQSLSVYDVSFLELALRRGVPLATFHRRLRTAAERVGVAVL